MADLKVNIGGLLLKNPVMTASGTFGYGEEFADFVDLSRLGGVIVKGTTLHSERRQPVSTYGRNAFGNAQRSRITKQRCQLLHRKYISSHKRYIDTHFLVNVSGSSIEDYAVTAEKIAALDKIPGIELNISCPNVKEGGMAFGTSCQSAAAVVKAVRAIYPKTLIVKLSPNVTDITEIARAVEAEGADAVSLINTLLGMAIDSNRRRPVLSTITGGLSGACVKPIALRMVWQTYHAVKIPIVGLGGITNATDAD